MSRDHPHFEALSAYVDGEAPEWADHVAGCPSCGASAGRLRAVAAAVGAPVEPPPAAQRDVAVTAALDGVTRRHGADVRRLDRRRWERRWALLSAAAVVVGVLGFSALLAVGTRSSDRTNLSSPAAPEAGPAGDALSETTAGGSAAASLPPTDLGEVRDAATLLARARPTLLELGTTSAAAGSTQSRPTGAPAGRRVPTPAMTGTRPCEEQARMRDPALREVVYFATARRGEVPAIVLGFATAPDPAPDPAPVILVLLAQEDCSELLRVAGP